MHWRDFRTTYAHGRPLVVAHRGVPVSRPENTLASFRLALEMGANALETDLHFSADDQIVLHHDPTLERMTDGSGPVRGRTLAELKQLRTRMPDGAWVNEPISTLLELITLTNSAVPLLLELKDPLFLDEKYARILAELLAATGMTDKVALVSFHFDYVLSVERVAPGLPIGFITMDEALPKLGAQLQGPYWPLLQQNPEYVKQAHDLGSVVAPLDTTPEDRVPWYLSLDVDALLADDPAAVIAALDQATA